MPEYKFGTIDDFSNSFFFDFNGKEQKKYL